MVLIPILLYADASSGVIATFSHIGTIFCFIVIPPCNKRENLIIETLSVHYLSIIK